MKFQKLIFLLEKDAHSIQFVTGNPVVVLVLFCAVYEFYITIFSRVFHHNSNANWATDLKFGMLERISILKHIICFRIEKICCEKNKYGIKSRIAAR